MLWEWCHIAPTQFGRYTEESLKFKLKELIYWNHGKSFVFTSIFQFLILILTLRIVYLICYVKSRNQNVITYFKNNLIFYLLDQKSSFWDDKVTEKLLSISNSYNSVFGEHPRNSSHIQRKNTTAKEITAKASFISWYDLSFFAMLSILQHASTEIKRNPQAHKHVTIIWSANHFAPHWPWQFYKNLISSWLNCSWTAFFFFLFSFIAVVTNWLFCNIYHSCSLTKHFCLEYIWLPKCKTSALFLWYFYSI